MATKVFCDVCGKDMTEWGDRRQAIKTPDGNLGIELTANVWIRDGKPVMFPEQPDVCAKCIWYVIVRNIEAEVQLAMQETTMPKKSRTK